MTRIVHVGDAPGATLSRDARTRRLTALARMGRRAD